MHNYAYMQISALALLLGAAAFSPVPLLASSSGLNNIPTTDTAGNRVLVFQDYVTSGAQTTANNFVAFKTGWSFLQNSTSPLRMEFGMDGRTNPGDGAPLLQVKFAYQPEAKGPALCVGIANIAATPDQRARAGQPYSYFVASQSIGVARLHAGYALQSFGGNSAILGIDRSVRVAKRDLVLRGDAIQIDRGANWAASAGAIYVVAKHFAFEAWVTQPAHNRPASFTFKLDLIAAN